MPSPSEHKRKPGAHRALPTSRLLPSLLLFDLAGSEMYMEFAWFDWFAFDLRLVVRVFVFTQNNTSAIRPHCALHPGRSGRVLGHCYLFVNRRVAAQGFTRAINCLRYMLFVFSIAHKRIPPSEKPSIVPATDRPLLTFAGIAALGGCYR